MRSALSFSALRIFGVATLAGALGLVACDNSAPGTASGTGGTTAGTGGATTGTGGAATGGAPGTGGVSGTGGSASGGVSGGPDASTPDAVGPDATATGWGGVPGIEDFSVVKPTEGCGMEPGQTLNNWFRYAVTIPPPVPGRGTGNREFFVKLPTSYDKMKPYFLIFTVPGCGGKGDRPPFDYTAAAGTEGVIQIGLTPDPGASQNGGGTCFDDKRTMSVEYPYFEKIMEITSKKLCFNQHKVFFAGHSSGSWVSNQMGCVYGMKKVRAISPASGGLADQPSEAPPCTDLPTPGIWNHNEDEVVPTGNPISGTIVAINRALKVNRCGPGNYNTAPRVPYTTNPDCQRFSGCPAEFPIVLCHPKTGGHGGNLPIQPARTWMFFKSLP